MSWLQKISTALSTQDMMEHAVKAIQMTVPGFWEIAENSPNLMRTFDLQRYGIVTLHGVDIYQPNDEFVVKVFGMVQRSPNRIPRDLMYDQEQSQRWIDENTVPVNEFDSSTGHNFVYYHCVVAGFIPGRNWEQKHQVRFIETKNPTYEIGNTREGESRPIRTPFELSKWVKDTIEKGYQDFGNNDDSDPDAPMFPEWPYSENEFTDDSDDLARVVAPRVRGYIG